MRRKGTPAWVLYPFPNKASSLLVPKGTTFLSYECIIPLPFFIVLSPMNYFILPSSLLFTLNIKCLGSIHAGTRSCSSSIFSARLRAFHPMTLLQPPAHCPCLSGRLFVLLLLEAPLQETSHLSLSLHIYDGSSRAVCQLFSVIHKLRINFTFF